MLDSPVDPRQFKSRLSQLTLVPVVLALLIAAGLIVQIQYLVGVADRLAQPEHAIAGANGIRALVLDAETGIRGFLLANDDRFLEPYTSSQQSIAGAFEALRLQVADHPEQVARVDRIQELQREWLDLAEMSLQLHRSGGDFLSIVKSGRGKKLVDAVRNELDEFILAERKRREVLFADSQRATGIAMWFTAGLALVLGLAIGIVARRQFVALTSTYGDALEVAQRSVAALQKSEEQYRLLVDGITDYAILGLDSGGRIATWNDGARGIFGYTADDIIGQPFTALLADGEPRAADDALGILTGMSKAGAHLSTSRCRRNDEATFHGEMCVNAIHDHFGMPVGFSLLVRDATVRKELDAAIRLQNERLEAGVRERTADLEAANRLLEVESASLLAAKLKAQHYADEVRDLYDNAPCAYQSVDENGVIVLVNDTELKWLGRTREEVLGKLRFRDILTPASQATFDENLPRFKSNGQLEGLELELQRSDGRPVYVLANAIAAHDVNGQYRGSRATLIDITRRRLTEIEAVRVRERYAALIRASSMAVYTLDANGFGTDDSVAAAWESITGITKDADDLTWWVESIHPDDRERIRSEFKNAVATRTAYEMELRARTQAGAYRVFLSKAVPILEADGTFREWVGTLTDVTARADAERTVRELNERLGVQVKELHSANSELNAFAYSVSHDLRAPLRAIDGFSRILSEDCSVNLTAECLGHLDVIRENTVHMGRLIDDLLAFSRLGRAPVTVERVETRELVQHVLGSMDINAADRRVKIVLGDLPSCTADPHLLQLVFQNLIANALKYSGKREDATVEIGSTTLDDSDSGPVFYVRDNGVGFDMRYAGKLFGVFQRLHRSEDYEGTGVGLAIVHRIVTKHGGRAWAEGAVNAGATFSFSLPPEASA